MQPGAGIFRLPDDAVHSGILTLTQAVCALLIVSARRGWRHKTIDWLYFWTAAFKWIWALDLAEVPLNVTIYPAKVWMCVPAYLYHVTIQPPPLLISSLTLKRMFWIKTT